MAESSTLIGEPVPSESLDSEDDGPEITADAATPEHDPWAIPPFPHPLREPWRAAGWIGARVFGVVSLVLLLGIVASRIPYAKFVVGFYVLGYLLEAEGRVARSGRVRDGFPLLGIAPRLGGMVLAVAFLLLPVMLVNAAAREAAIVDPDSAATGRMQTTARIVTVLIAVHLCLSLARGGRFTNFLRPIRNVRWLWSRWREGDYWTTAERHVLEFVARLRLREFWWLGLRGYLVAFVWLAVPSAVLAFTPREVGGVVVVGLLGSILLGIVLSWVPILQARFAAEGRFTAGLQLGEARSAFRRAPLCWAIAMLVVYALSLPLYLFKIAPLPSDAMWLATIVFVASIWPTRIVTGWAYARSTRREQAAHWLWRWSAWLLVVATLTAYLFLLFFTPYVVDQGHDDRFFHHAFLLPSPY